MSIVIYVICVYASLSAETRHTMPIITLNDWLIRLSAMKFWCIETDTWFFHVDLNKNSAHIHINNKNFFYESNSTILAIKAMCTMCVYKPVFFKKKTSEPQTILHALPKPINATQISDGKKNDRQKHALMFFFLHEIEQSNNWLITIVSFYL